SRFDMVPGESFGDHSHPEAEIRWVVSGCMRVTIGHDEIILAPGDRLDLAAEVIHSADVVGDEVAVTVCASRCSRMLEITLLLGIVAVITLIGWWVHPSRLHASLTPDQHRRVKFWFVSAESVMSSRSRAGWRQLSGFSSSNSRFHRCRRVLPPSSGAPIAL